MTKKVTPPVALITGAAKRLGAAIAKSLHAQGYNVVIHYRHSKVAAHALASELNQNRPKSCVCAQADLSKIKDMKGLSELASQQWGRIDVLINNASSFYPTYIGETTEEKWDDLLSSNCKAPFFLSQLLVPELQKHQGVIINMIDIHANAPLKNHTVYCMAKSALSMMTLSLAKELAPKIRVNGISPGAILWPELAGDEILNNMIDSELSESAGAESQKKNIIASIPLGRLGKVDEIAETVFFLVKSDYITGQIIAVDGGRSLAG